MARKQSKDEKPLRSIGVRRGIAGVEVKDLLNNEPAIKMLQNSYNEAIDERTSLKNEINTLNTYLEGYRRLKQRSGIGSWLLFLSNISIAFGVNLITNGSVYEGSITLIPGIALSIYGLILTNRDSG